ncbi:hypothetical protein Neosp_013824 [[Neocosmospora] mangrovei]
MSDLPAPLPCWPCVRKTIVNARSFFLVPQGPFQDERLDEVLDWVLKVNCSWDLEGDQYLDGRCTECICMENACGTVPSQLEKKTKDVVATMAYIDMVINLNRRVQVKYMTPYEARHLPTEDQDCSSEIRVLYFGTRKNLVAATAKLGIRLTVIVEFLQGNNDPASLVENPNESPDQPRRRDATHTDFLSWNAIVREFHSDVLEALQRADLEENFINTIMEQIPIKWVPSVNKDVLEDARDAIMQVAPTI